MDSNQIIFIVGPTAVGKSEAAVLLAEHLGGEIVSCDSMQVYQEINIASSKPSPEMLKRVPHHLIGVIPIRDEFDVAAFNARALASIHQIRERGHVPIVCGGSGLYMSVLLDGIFEGPSRDASLRAEFEREAEQKGEESLYARLKAVDEQAAAKIHPRDRRRIMRALEVFEMRKVPLSQLQKNRQGLWGGYNIKIIALNRDRDELYERINQRVDRMFDEGLVEEVRSLTGTAWSSTAEKIIGVRELKGYLAQEYDLEQARALIKMNTRRYAKRQLTWFRKDQRLGWLDLEAEESPQKTAQRIEKVVSDE